MIQIEYRYPWAERCWSSFSSARILSVALELLDLCRVEHPGSECRIRNEDASVDWRTTGVS